MKKRLIVGLAVVFVMTMTAAGWAAIDLTAHDITAAYATLSRQGICSACHVPHKSLGKRLWPQALGTNATYGDVGDMCYYCHGAGSSVGDAITTMPWFNGEEAIGTNYAHGIIKAHSPDGDAAINTADNQALMPYCKPANTTIECTTCHNVHDDTNKPFLNADIDILCSLCHTQRQFVGGSAGTTQGDWGAFYGDANPGSHPVGPDVTGDNDGAGNSPFTNFALTVYVYDAGAGTHNLGAHAIDGAVTNLSAGMGCVTCHAPHGIEPDTKLSSVFAQDDLLVVAQAEVTDAGVSPRDTMHANGAADVAELCEICHGGTSVGSAAYGGTNFVNPGSQAMWTHPVDDYPTAGSDFNVTAFPAGWPVGLDQAGGGTPDINCESCHMPHPVAAAAGAQDAGASTAMAGNHILRDDEIDLCTRCHSATFTGHHPVGAIMGGAGAQFDPAYGDASGNDLDADGNSTVGDGDAILSCGDCHAGAGAHNWSSVGFPGLDPDWDPNTSASPALFSDNGRVDEAADRAAGAAIHLFTSHECIVCHFGGEGSYPVARMSPTGSNFTPDAGEGEYQAVQGTASHYLGLVNAATSGRVDGTPTLLNALTGTWPIGGWSRWAGAAAAEEVVCESCHDLEPDKNNSTAAGLDLLLMDFSENKNEPRSWFCEGCHFDSLTGSTHPMTGDTVGKADSDNRPTITLITGAGSYAPTATSPATYPAGNTMNCDSCHQVHNANSESGTFILDSNNADTSSSLSIDVDASGVTWTGTKYDAAGTDTFDYKAACNYCHPQGN